MKTTLNLHKTLLAALATAAASRGISRSAMAVILLRKELAGFKGPGYPGTLVRYQERAGADEWHTFHIRFRPDEYEYFHDMRRLGKFSVSYFLQRAIKKYILQKRKTNIGDNYHYKNYMIIRGTVDNIICWQLYWGYPRGIEKILRNKHPARSITPFIPGQRSMQAPERGKNS